MDKTETKKVPVTWAQIDSGTGPYISVNVIPTPHGLFDSPIRIIDREVGKVIYLTRGCNGHPDRIVVVDLPKEEP